MCTKFGVNSSAILCLKRRHTDTHRHKHLWSPYLMHWLCWHGI